jgi:hypothetical protein
MPKSDEKTRKAAILRGQSSKGKISQWLMMSGRLFYLSAMSY